MTGRGGHIYVNSDISGHGRGHFGNVYNYGPSQEEEVIRSVLESLKYDGMDDRRDRLNGAERGTFEWTLAEKQTQTHDVEEDDESDTNEQSDETDDEEDNPDCCGVDVDSASDLMTIDTSFATWLGGETEDLFCFLGKPGSGKSTLMYVVNPSELPDTSCAD